MDSEAAPSQSAGAGPQVFREDKASETSRNGNLIRPSAPVLRPAEINDGRGTPHISKLALIKQASELIAGLTVTQHHCKAHSDTLCQLTVITVLEMEGPKTDRQEESKEETREDPKEQ